MFVAKRDDQIVADLGRKGRYVLNGKLPSLFFLALTDKVEKFPIGWVQRFFHQRFLASSFSAAGPLRKATNGPFIGFEKSPACW